MTVRSLRPSTTREITNIVLATMASRMTQKEMRQMGLGIAEVAGELRD
jgi:hypothetical protein